VTTAGAKCRAGLARRPVCMRKTVHVGPTDFGAPQSNEKILRANSVKNKNIFASFSSEKEAKKLLFLVL
jgi:hypothetical protein